jgi:hypothetical protein
MRAGATPGTSGRPRGARPARPTPRLRTGFPPRPARQAAPDRNPPRRNASWSWRSLISTRYRPRVARSHCSGRCHGIGVRATSPFSPVSPSSSPAKILGVPGRVISSPAAATSCPPASPTTVRLRGVSCDPRRLHDAESEGGRAFGTQPRPQRTGEAGVVHRPVPPVVIEVAAPVVGVLGDERPPRGARDRRHGPRRRRRTVAPRPVSTGSARSPHRTMSGPGPARSSRALAPDRARSAVIRRDAPPTGRTHRTSQQRNPGAAPCRDRRPQQRAGRDANHCNGLPQAIATPCSGGYSS